MNTTYRYIFLAILCCTTAIACQLIHEHHENERASAFNQSLKLDLMGLGGSIETAASMAQDAALLKP